MGISFNPIVHITQSPRVTKWGACGVNVRVTTEDYRDMVESLLLTLDLMWLRLLLGEAATWGSVP